MAFNPIAPRAAKSLWLLTLLHLERQNSMAFNPIALRAAKTPKTLLHSGLSSEMKGVVTYFLVSKQDPMYNM